MPRIAQYTNRAELDASPLATAASAQARAGAARGAAFEAVGALGTKIQKTIDDHEAQNEISKTADALTNFELEQSQAYDKAKANADPNDDTFAEKYLNEQYTPALDKMGDNLSTEKGQQYFAEARNRLRLGFGQKVIADQSNMTANAHLSNAEGSANKLAIAASNDPSLTAQILGNVDTLLGPLVPAEKRGEVLAKFKEGIANAGAERTVSMLESNPHATIADAQGLENYLNDPKNGFVDNMSDTKHSELMARLDKFKETQSGIQGALLKQAHPALIEQIKNGGGPAAVQQDQNLINLYVGKTDEETVVNRSAMQRELAAAQSQGDAAAKVRELPNDQIASVRAETMAQYQAASTDEDRLRLKGQLDGIDAGQKSRDTEFHADPAVYAINHNPTVSARAQAFAKKPDAQTFNDYATASEAYQRQLYPGEVPKYATKAMSDQIGASMQALRNDPKATAQAGQTLATWQQTTGSRWVQVAHELYGAHVLNEDQFAAAQLYTKPQGAVLAQTLLQASAMSGSELYALHGVSYQAVEAQAIPELQDLAQSLGNTGPAGAALMRANVTALAHLMQVQGPDADVHALANTLVNDEFNFRGRHGSTTLRIPTSAGDPDQIQAGTQKVLDNVGTLPLVIPKSLTGLGDADQRLNYIDRLQHDGVWYTNKDGSGAVLYDIDSGDPVREMKPGASPSPQQIFQKNQAYVKPGAHDYNTKLSAPDEQKFREWVKTNHVEFNVSAKVTDYDMRGFWKAAQNGDSRAQTAINPNDHRIHYNDYWKTPYHKSFSAESQWANGRAPKWNEKDQLVTPDGRVVFDERASQQNSVPVERKWSDLVDKTRSASPTGIGTIEQEGR